MTTQTPTHRSRGLPAATATLHRLLYLLSALPLAGVWIALLVGGWALSAGLVITPLVFGVLIGFGVCVRFMAWVEGYLARRLLRAPAYPRRAPSRRGNYWQAGIATLRDGRFWRGQAFGWLRAVLGLITGVITLAFVANGLGYATAPIWYRFIPGSDGEANGIDTGIWHVDTLGESILLMPAGIALLAIGIALIHLFGSMWRRIAVGVLGGNND
jgi:putative sensor protein